MPWTPEKIKESLPSKSPIPLSGGSSDDDGDDGDGSDDGDDGDDDGDDDDDDDGDDGGDGGDDINNVHWALTMCQTLCQMLHICYLIYSL